VLLSCELESSESLQALLAVAMLTQSQQLYGLTRHQAASARARLASASAVGTSNTASVSTDKLNSQEGCLRHRS